MVELINEFDNVLRVLQEEEEEEETIQEKKRFQQSTGT